MKKLVCLGLLLVVMADFTACSNMDNSDVGTLGGAAIGGLLGSRFGGGSGQVAAAAGGAMLGAFIGNRIGASMDRNDRAAMYNVIDQNSTGQATSWVNPDNGNHYTVTPTRTYYQGNYPCREYVTNAVIGGRNQKVYGTACRQADGSWQAQNGS